ncbi:MAG: peptidylprolyl isomerase [Litoreibacter sp.]|nr:peptidylprolyl isomerase [Litoreibacter sp.]
MTVPTLRPITAFLMSMALALVAGALQPASAQSPFQTVLTVNQLAITQYELDQREQILRLLRSPGDPRVEARKSLIDDRLRTSAIRNAGIALSQEEIQEGITEFAGRANRSAEDFIKALNQEGVATETVRDFVSTGVAWRNLVRGRFGPRARVTPAEIERALALSSTRGGARVLISELVVPMPPENEGEIRGLMKELSETIRSFSDFSAAAQRYSRASTAPNGGRLDWLPLANLPPQVRTSILTLSPGQVTDPIVLGGAIGIFQLRRLEELDPVEPETLALDYATILIPGGRSEAALARAREIEDETDTCDDLYKTAQDLPEGYFERSVLAAAEVPGDIALELAKLDIYETSFALTRQNDQFLIFTRLCGRTVQAPLSEDGTEIDLRTRIRDQLFQQRLASFANSYLEELRADAIIIEQ